MSQDERKAALITGAASGIGRATAERFAEGGWWVGLVDRDREGVDALRAQLGAERCSSWELDVTDKAAFDRVVSEVSNATGGRLDLLHNNAGIAVAGPFGEIPIEEMARVVDVNLVGVLNGIHAALPLLKETPGSVCFSTSSSAATYGTPGLAVYAATKFAVKGLTEALAVELAPFDVRVADVLPGYIDTAIFSTSRVHLGGGQVTTADVMQQGPAPTEGAFRLVQPQEVAEAVWRCCAGDTRMHWYVPNEIGDIDKAKAASPEAMRDERIAAQAASTARR